MVKLANLIEPLLIALLLIQSLFIEAIFIVTAFFYSINFFFWFWVSQLLVDMRMTRRSSMIIRFYYLKWAAILMSYLWMDFVIHILVKPRFEPCLRNWNVLLTYYFWIWIVIISENAYCLQAYCQLWTYILYLNCFGIEFFLRQSFAMSKGENLSGVGVVLRLRLNTYLTPSIHINSWMYGWLQTLPLLHEILVGLPSLW